MTVSPPFGIAVTPDMISPPISPSSRNTLNFPLITPAVHSALEYVSRKLHRQHLHLTLIVSRTTPLPVGQGCKLSAYPVSRSLVDETAQRLFFKIVRRAATKFFLQTDWLTYQRHAGAHWESIVRRSLVQNDVLFSAESLTLFNIDRVYTLKQALNVLSRGEAGYIPESIYFDLCIWLLRRIMKETHGRPLSRAFFHCTYDHISVSDVVLRAASKGYFARYKQPAIVFPARTRKPDSIETTYVMQKQKQKRTGKIFEGKSPEIGSHISLHNSVSSSRSKKSPRPGPKTPLSASDISPVTLNEWNTLMQVPMETERSNGKLGCSTISRDTDCACACG